MSDSVQRTGDHGSGGEGGGSAHVEHEQDDSAVKTLQVMLKANKMLKAGHALVDKQSIQKRFAGAPGPTSLYRCVPAMLRCSRTSMAIVRML